MDSKNPRVVVYSTPTCPYCIMVKKYLAALDVPFEDVDVSKDDNKAQEMIEKSGQIGVPVIDINGKIIVGFNKDAIDRALGI
ncbi:MAG: glutaredoxin domain-containing protein [Candidatus Micrarchaeia archaeon]